MGLTLLECKSVWGHVQTVQTQFRRRRTRRLIRGTLFAYKNCAKYNKNENIHQVPLKLETDISYNKYEQVT